MLFNNLDETRIVKRKRWQFDKFGIEKLYPTIPHGREFYLPDNLPSSKVHAVNRIENTEMVVHGDGAVTPCIIPAQDHRRGAAYYKMEGRIPRLYIYNENPNSRWANVEMTCYYNKSSPSTTESAGFVMGVRSFHHLGGTNAKVYYLKHHFNNKAFFFLKEHEHGGSGNSGYVDTFDRCPDSQLNDNEWYGAKFVVRTKSVGTEENHEDDRAEMTPHVVLEAFMDNTDGMNGGEWKKLFEFTDNGTWNSFLPYMYGPSCMVRTDGVTDFRIKKLSIRTINPFIQNTARSC